MKITKGLSIGAVIAMSAVLAIPTAEASVGSAAPPVASATIQAQDAFRLDRQGPLPAVVFKGVSNQTTVRVDWGDGTDVVSARGPCSLASARSHRTGCAVTLRHEYGSAGQFTIAARSGRVSARKTVSVAPVPVAWRPPDGWIQPAGWSTMIGATFTPCETVGWYFDRSAEPSDRWTMKDDVVAVLSMLAPHTGLRFVEVASADEAQLVMRWQALQGWPGAWTVSPEQARAEIKFATDTPYTRDEFAGLGTLRVGYTDGTGTHEADIPGRGWYVAKHIMAGLGLWEVTDPGQVMYEGYFGPGALGAGDLDGLHTMYLSQPCPAMPD